MGKLHGLFSPGANDDCDDDKDNNGNNNDDDKENITEILWENKYREHVGSSLEKERKAWERHERGWTGSQFVSANGGSDYIDKSPQEASREARQVLNLFLPMVKMIICWGKRQERGSPGSQNSTLKSYKWVDGLDPTLDI